MKRMMQWVRVALLAAIVVSIGACGTASSELSMGAGDEAAFSDDEILHAFITLNQGEIVTSEPLATGSAAVNGASSNGVSGNVSPDNNTGVTTDDNAGVTADETADDVRGNTSGVTSGTYNGYGNDPNTNPVNDNPETGDADVSRHAGMHGDMSAMQADVGRSVREFAQMMVQHH